MPRGWVSPARAARMLGIHRNTTYTHARRCVEGRPSMFETVEHAGEHQRYLIAVTDVQRLLRVVKDTDDK